MKVDKPSASIVSDHSTTTQQSNKARSMGTETNEKKILSYLKKIVFILKKIYPDAKFDQMIGA